MKILNICLLNNLK